MRRVHFPNHKGHPTTFYYLGRLRIKVVWVPMVNLCRFYLEVIRNPEAEPEIALLLALLIGAILGVVGGVVGGVIFQ